MKKVGKLLLILLIIAQHVSPAISQETKNDKELAINIVNKICTNKPTSEDPRKDVISLFNLHTKYSIDHDIENLKNLYADTYINNDGFDKNTYFDLINKTWEQYPIVNYTSIVKNLTIDGDSAKVQMLETATGTTKAPIESVRGLGSIKAESNTYYYLQKIGPYWKIVASDVISEVTSLKYGEAKNIPMSINAPSMVKADQNYTVALSANIPTNYFILASLTNEPITFPQKQPKEVFRNIKRKGIIERVIKANNDNCNEYAVASIGVTKAEISNGQAMNINLSGIAFIMSRVNVVHLTPGKNQTTKEVTK